MRQCEVGLEVDHPLILAERHTDKSPIITGEGSASVQLSSYEDPWHVASRNDGKGSV